jgi:hypothetical protein
MRKLALAGVAALALVGSTAVYAQYNPWANNPWVRAHWQYMRLTPDDRAALADARIAAIHAGLKLTPDQEKMWPPVESAVRDFAKLRIDRATARMKARAELGDEQPKPQDPIARLRDRADNMAASAAALKKIADAAEPLYQTLDDGQKRRLAILTHRRGAHVEGWRHRWLDRGMRHDDRGGERGMDDGNGGHERL